MLVPCRCRASSDCPGYLVNYERESCFRVDFNTDDRRDDLIPATSRVNYYEKVCLEGNQICFHRYLIHLSFITIPLRYFSREFQKICLRTFLSQYHFTTLFLVNFRKFVYVHSLFNVISRIFYTFFKIKWRFYSKQSRSKLLVIISSRYSLKMEAQQYAW